nr:transferrin-binding protein-like solute binding protein [Alphaproteobacteria bacterium]
TLDFLITNQTDHDSLHAVAITDGSNSFTMNGLAVYQSNQTDYARVPNKGWGDASTDTDQEITIGRLSDSGAAIIFDGNGNISGIATYLSLNPYIATNIYTATIASPISATDVVGQTINSDDTPDDTTSAVMNIYRGESFFGFKSYYMSYIDWRVARTFDDLGDGTIDRSYDYSGAMLAGIETVNYNISSAGIFNFTGKGQGFYHNSNTGIGGQTIFDVTANVNFASKSLSINSSNTIACGDFSNIASCTSNVGEFSTGAISYIDNNISTDNVTANIAGNSLTGTLDARFYGGDGYELGGTFALTESNMTGGDYSYYGAFGAEIIYHTSFETLATTHADTPTSFNQHNLTGFNASNRHNKTNNALKATAVQITRDDTTTNQTTIKTERITGAVVEFDYDFNGWFASSGVRFYFSDKKYSVTSVGNSYRSSNYIYDYSPDAGSADTPNYFYLSKQGSDLRVTTTHMAGVYWRLNQTAYDAYGFAITGFETITIPTTHTTIFTGRGRGYYYRIDSWNGDDVYFDVIANVDFSKRKVDIRSTNTCKSTVDHQCIRLQRPEFNFTGILSYVAGTNNISGAIATAGSYTRLTGTADARFYGTGTNAAKEFGGTFSLQNSRTGYVGWFGTQQKFTINSIATNHADTPTTFNQHQLTGFDDPNRVSKSNNALPATAVQITKKSGNPIITEKITDAVAEFDISAIDEWGDTDFNGLSFYYADKKYSTTNGQGSSSGIFDSSPDAGSADTPDVIKLTKASASYFNFYPDYMAVVHWELDKSAYDTYGYGITGFETGGNNIPTTGTTRFSSKGRGHYYSGGAMKLLYFAVTADVDFNNRNVSMTGTNTCINWRAVDCTQSHDQRHHLDWAGELSYEAGKNIISGTIATDADGYEDLIGRAEARFYGPNAEEFGGTFAMQNAGEGYVGFFGAERPGYITPTPTPPTAPTNPFDSLNNNNLTGFADNARKGTENNKLLAIAASVTKNKHKTVSNGGITSAAIEFDYASNGDFVGHGFTLHLPDRKYSTASGSSGQSTYILANTGNKTYAFDSDGNSIAKADQLGFSKSVFGFNAEYMGAVRWRVTESSYETLGYAITGFDTIGTDIPTIGTGTVSFIGKGFGQYYDNSAYSIYSNNGTSANRYYKVSANINFATRRVALTSENTCSSSSASDCATGSSNLYPHLDWTGELSYASGMNVITGNLETKGDAGNTKLTGTAEARFYGPLAQEFGGTFSLSNATSGYVGFFGAKKIATITTITHPTSFNANNLTSFNDAQRGTNAKRNNNALKATAVQITKQKTGNRTIITDKITGAVAEFSYTTDRHFDDSGFSFYYADKKYSATNGNGTQHYIVDASPDAGTADAPNNFVLSKSTSYFTNVPLYMALVAWRLNETAYDANGYAITGFETAGNNILTSGTNVNFTGKGRGKYYSATASNYLYFNVTANVNFSTRNVALFSTNTCRSNSTSCPTVSLQRHYLNFTGNLSYAAGTNNISGTIETTGDADNAKLTGTAEARFYGPSAEELGGTFTMQNADEGYVGYFGARKP